MILINLLPHREAARKRRKDQYKVAVLVSMLLGGAIAGAVQLAYQEAISSQKEANDYLGREIKKLDDQIKQIAELESEIAALKARKQAVEDLQTNRNMPTHLLMELVKQLPDGVYITKFAQSDSVITINGVAQSNERVSELLRNISSNTPWLSKPELIEIVAANVDIGKEKKRIGNFIVRAKLSTAAEAEKNIQDAGKLPNNLESAASKSN